MANPVADNKILVYIEIVKYYNGFPGKDVPDNTDFDYHMITYNSDNERLGCITLTYDQAVNMNTITDIKIIDGTEYDTTWDKDC